MAQNAPTECPNDDTLGALVEHALDAAEATRVSAHIDTCDACRAIVIAAVRGESQTPPTVALGTPSLPRAGSLDAEALVGTRMGRYEIRSMLGAGGMGQVFAAYDAELDRSIALKILRPELARAASVLADRLVRESRLMAKVAHPSVITVYDVGREGDAVFIAMELIRGETLGAFISRVKPAWRDVLAIFERAGHGLMAAHDAGIVHRDFKPDNVLVESTGNTVTKLVVTDFGIAMAAVFAEAVRDAGADSKDPKLTATGAAIGTPAYMAPEQLAGALVDRRADVFAFCVALWEAVFGARPFLGKSVDEIKQAMRVRPRAPRVNIVPGRLIRVLERGLQINPDLRWPDMRAVLRELTAVRSTQRRRWMYAGIGGTALVGLGIAGALVLTRSTKFDPCAKSLDAFAATANRARDVAGVLDAVTRQKLDDNVTHWRATHRATCDATKEPARQPTVAACLDARALEIDAFIDDVKRDGGKAARLSRVMLDPARCKDPRQGLLFARVPADPAQRRAASELRYRAVEIEAARDRGELAPALEDAVALVADSKSAWPPVQAELLYLLGTVQAVGGNNDAATATLRDAAALGERTHHGYVVANAWIQLIQTAPFDDIEDDNRAMEYATYADAALDGIGRPPELEVLFLYFKATAMVEAGQGKEAEALFERAIAIAESTAPQYFARAALGLGYLYEDQSRYADAVAIYRRGILALSGSTLMTSAHTFRERLAINLALLGQSEEAERVARDAVAIADRTLAQDNPDRAVVHTTLGQVLHQIGKSEAGLAEVRRGRELFVAAIGERTERFGEILSLEGNILVEMNRPTEALPVLARACEVIEQSLGDFTTQHAECLLDHATALDNTGKSATALKLADRAIDTLEMVDVEPHVRTATAYLQRGMFAASINKQKDAVADFQRAIAAFEKLQLEPGHLAGAKWALGRVLWKSDHARAKKLVEEAVALFAKASPSWGAAKADAETWLRTDGRPPPP